MKYSSIKYYDIANGAGVRTSLFVSGCRFCCYGCFNSPTWEFDFGDEFTQDTINDILESLKPDFIDGLSILGGEPLEPENQSSVLNLIKQTRDRYPEKDIWLWTGFTLEALLSKNTRASTEDHYLEDILQNIDVLVDGQFEIDKKDITLRFRGSSNQRIIDIHKTLELDELVLWSDGPIFSTH